MRNKLAFKNMLASVILQILVSISGIILPRFFLEAYGSAVNGMVSSINQFISYLALVEAGVGTAATVALYHPIAEEDHDGVNGILSAAKSFYLRSGGLFLILVAALTFAYPLMINNQLEQGLVRYMVLILASSTVVDYLFLGKYRVLLTADQRGYVVTGAQAFGTVLNIAVTVWLIQVGAGVLAVKAAATLIYILRFFIVYAYVKRSYAYLDFKKRPNKAALGQRWDALLHQVVGIVVNNTDLVLMTVFMGSGSLVEVSVYSIYNMVAYALALLLNSFSTGLGAGFGEIISRGEKETLKRSFSNFEYLYDMVVFWCYICMGVLLLPFVALYTRDIHDAQYVRPLIAILFTVVGLIQNIRIPGLTIICAAGHFRQTRYRAVLEAVINFTISIILVKPLGMVGVLIGTICSYGYRSLDVIIYNARRLVPGTLKLSLQRLLRNGAAALALILAGSRIVPDEPSGYLTWFLYAVLTGAAGFVALVFLNVIAEPEQFAMLKERTRGILQKKGFKG